MINGVIRWEFPALNADERKGLVKAVMDKMEGADDEAARLRKYLVTSLGHKKGTEFKDIKDNFSEHLELILGGVQ